MGQFNEPWTASKNGGGVIVDSQQRTIAQCPFFYMGEGDPQVRVISCINALAGMDPEKVTEVVKAAVELADDVEGTLDNAFGQNRAMWKDSVLRLRTALAKLKGEA